ncbi:hypothetical protein E2562_032078 [Oryza meyeriana var. granulata]|uniref:Uncharacterized protein n=1 Tax=Oryza meyeriana var. granulata TaxID=110450 RepID=A0A6G1CK15_9ORYZ|nr:hypothetical protein E2562_032078 [Oryza meyeriana var. granulata]
MCLPCAVACVQLDSVLVTDISSLMPLISGGDWRSGRLTAGAEARSRTQDPGYPGTHAGPRAGKVPGHARRSPGARGTRVPWRGTQARKLDRLAAAMAALYAELEALADLEQSARKLPTDEARRAL